MASGYSMQLSVEGKRKSLLGQEPLVAMPFVTSSVLVPSSKARSP